MADRLLRLVSDASALADDPGVGGAGGGVTVHPALAERRAETLAERRRRALLVLVGADGIEGGAGAIKSWPAGVLASSLDAALRATRLAEELGERATSLDIERAAALARATAAAGVDGKAEALARARAREWGERVAGGGGAAAGGGGLRAPTDDAASTHARPDRLFRSHDGPEPDPLASILSVEVVEPPDLPDAPDPAMPQPIHRSPAEGGGGGERECPPPARWNDASAAKDGADHARYCDDIRGSGVGLDYR